MHLPLRMWNQHICNVHVIFAKSRHAISILLRPQPYKMLRLGVRWMSSANSFNHTQGKKKSNRITVVFTWAPHICALMIILFFVYLIFLFSIFDIFSLPYRLIYIGLLFFLGCVTHEYAWHWQDWIDFMTVTFICNTEINKINIHFRCSHKRNCIYNHKIECKKMYIVPTRHGCYERSVQHPSSWVALGASFFCVYWEVAMIVHSTSFARK